MAGLRRAVERLEDVRKIFRLDTETGILDGEDYLPTLPGRLQDDRCLRPPMFPGVVQQVVE